MTRIVLMPILSFFIERQGKKYNIGRMSLLLFTGNVSSYITALDPEFRKKKLDLFGYFEYAGHFKNFLMSVALPEHSDIHFGAFEKDNDSSNTQTLLETFFSSNDSASLNSKIGSSLYRIPSRKTIRLLRSPLEAAVQLKERN